MSQLPMTPKEQRQMKRLGKSISRGKSRILDPNGTRAERIKARAQRIKARKQKLASKKSAREARRSERRGEDPRTPIKPGTGFRFPTKPKPSSKPQPQLGKFGRRTPIKLGKGGIHTADKIHWTNADGTRGTGASTAMPHDATRTKTPPASESTKTKLGKVGIHTRDMVHWTNADGTRGAGASTAMPHDATRTKMTPASERPKAQYAGELRGKIKTKK